MSENALRRTDKVRTTCLLRSQGDDNGGRVGQSDLPSNGGPTRKRRTLQAKEQKHAAKEAFNGTAFAQFLFGPGWRQTRAVLLSLGIPGNHGDGSQGGVNPVDELQAPSSGIQTDDARVAVVERDRHFQLATTPAATRAHPR